MEGIERGELGNWVRGYGERSIWVKHFKGWPVFNKNDTLL
jgi:hypothetical protein